ncbi:hypothetical protein ACFJGX_19950 [Hydrogenophaga sp. UC242_50]|uniref:hypothetical protein n=1 Tax=Hydrogenophaga sp. UC242_50 TaxID=3350169 RepID=UPI0036D4068A
MAGASAAAVVLVGQRLQRQQRVEQVDIAAARLVVKRLASLVVDGMDDVVIDLAFQGQAQPVEPVEGLSGEVGDFVGEALGAQASERVLERETKVDGRCRGSPGFGLLQPPPLLWRGGGPNRLEDRRNRKRKTGGPCDHPIRAAIKGHEQASRNASCVGFHMERCGLQRSRFRFRLPNLITPFLGVTGEV